MKGVKIYLLIMAFLSLFASIYLSRDVKNTKDKQPNNEQTVALPTETVLQVPTGTPPPGEKKHVYRPAPEEILQEIQNVFVTPEGTSWAYYIASCESFLNPYAVGSGTYYGLFQYHPSTYKKCGGKDIYDWREQIIITKICMYDHGRQNEFPMCNRRYLNQ